MVVRFFSPDELPSGDEYWGRIRFLGRLAPDTCMYQVDFRPDAPHLWHYHEQHELIVVTRGRILQAVGTGPGSLTEERELAAGACVHLPAGTWHSARPLDPDTRVVFTVCGRDGLYRAFEATGREIVGPGR